MGGRGEGSGCLMHSVSFGSDENILELDNDVTVVNILEITKSCILKWVKWEKIKWVKWQILSKFYLKYFKNVILYEDRKNRIKNGMKVEGNFEFTWVGQGSPICHWRTAEGDGG